MTENIVEIKLKNKEDYKNNYNSKILSYDLSNYILEESKSINSKQKIKIIVLTDFKMNENDKEEFVSMLRKNFGTDVSEIMNLQKKEYITNLVTLLIGLSLLVIYCVNFNTLFIAELILIIGWGFLWEAVYNFFFKGIETRLKIIRRKQIISSKIEFIQKNNTSK